MECGIDKLSFLIEDSYTSES